MRNSQKEWVPEKWIMHNIFMSQHLTTSQTIPLLLMAIQLFKKHKKTFLRDTQKMGLGRDGTW